LLGRAVRRLVGIPGGSLGGSAAALVPLQLWGQPRSLRIPLARAHPS